MKGTMEEGRSLVCFYRLNVFHSAVYNLQQQLRDPRLGPIRTWNRQNLTTWLCELHNVVNEDLKKPQHNCDAFMLDMEYLKDCGDCEPIKKKGSGFADAISKAAGSDYPAGYGGPWNMNMYARDPLYLRSVTSNSELFEAEELNDLLIVARTVLSPAQYAEVQNATTALMPPPAEFANDADTSATSPLAGDVSNPETRENIRREWLEALERRIVEPAAAVAELQEENVRLKAEISKLRSALADTASTEL